MRATMTVRLTARPRPRSSAGGVLVEAREDRRQLQADEHEHEALIGTHDVLQTPLPISRPSGERTRAARRPVMSPAVDRREDAATPSSSAGRKAAIGAMSETTISSIGSPVARDAPVTTADDDADEDPAEPDDHEVDPRVHERERPGRDDRRRAPVAR